MAHEIKEKKDVQDELIQKEIKCIKDCNTFVGWDRSTGFNLTTGGANFSMSVVSVAKRSAEKHELAKLTTEKVKIIKLLLRDTVMYLKEIGAVMNISFGTVHDIGRGRIWGCVTVEDTDSLDEKYREYTDLYPKERNTFWVFNVITGNFEGEFVNQRECETRFGVDYRNLNTILKGWKKEKSWKKTANGHTFIYKADYSQEWKKEVLPKLKCNVGKKFSVYNYRNGKLVKKFTNQNEGARVLGLNYIAIKECLWKNQSFHKDYIFIFEEDFNDKWLEELIGIAKINKKKSNQKV